MSDKEIEEHGFIVKLDSKDFLSGFEYINMWPQGESNVVNAKVFDDKETATYAKEVCKEKLNNSYNPVVKKITIIVHG